MAVRPYQRLLVIGVIALVGLSAVLGVSLLGTDLLRRTHADQSPANCSSNDFVLTVQKSLTYFSDTATVHYTVLAGNPNTSGAGCDVGGVTLSLTTPDGTVHPLGDDLDYPIGTAEAVIGGASYVPSTSAPDYNGWFGYNGVAWVAMAEATGQLLDNPVQDDPWQVRKTVSVVPVSIAMSALASPPGEVPAGTVVTVSFVLHNDGIGPLENPQVTSPQCNVAPVPPTGSNQGDVNGNGVADPGETWIFTCPLVVTESIDVTGVGSGRLAASDLVIDPSNDPDATVTLRIHVAASDDPTGDGPSRRRLVRRQPDRRRPVFPTAGPAMTRPATTRLATTRPAMTRLATTRPATTRPAMTPPATTRPPMTRLPMTRLPMTPAATSRPAMTRRVISPPAMSRRVMTRPATHRATVPRSPRRPASPMPGVAGCWA